MFTYFYLIWFQQLLWSSSRDTGDTAEWHRTEEGPRDGRQPEKVKSLSALPGVSISPLLEASSTFGSQPSPLPEKAASHPGKLSVSEGQNMSQHQGLSEIS